MSRKHRKKGGDPSADWEFVFDGVFGFLSSPLWSVPVMSFIDEKCVVFEPSEENHLEWTSIHKKYSALVEQLLEGYLKDVGISEKEFMKACMSPSVQRNVEMQMMFEQIFAGEDFEIFKNMMIQRNVELELEALKLVRQRQGKKPSSKDKKPRVDKQQGEVHVPTEDEILQEVMRRSEEEYKEAQRRRSLQDEEYNETMEKMIAQTAQEAERLEQDVKAKQEETKRAVEESIKSSPTAPPYTPPPEYTPTPQVDSVSSSEPELAEADGEPETSQPSAATLDTYTDFPSPTQSPTPPITTAPEAAEPPPETQPEAAAEPSTIPSTASPAKAPLAPVRAPVSAPSPPLSPIKGLVERERLPSIPQSSSDAASHWLQSAKEESAASTSSVGQRVQNNSALSADDMKKREEYLKQQRDRIQKMKNEERSKQLQTYADTNAAERPMATKIAHEAMVSGEVASSSMTSDEEKQLAMRKVLAEKLKKEVVYKDGGK